MTQAFSRSMRAIEADGGGLTKWLGPAALLIVGAWGLWMTRSEVPIYASSSDARLVSERAVYRIESGVSGRIAAVRVALDDRVEAGTVLLELESVTERLALAEERERSTTLETQIDSATDVLRALERARDNSDDADEARSQEAQFELDTLALELEIAIEEADRLAQLEVNGTVAELTVSKARAAAAKAQVAVESQEVKLGRLRLESQSMANDRDAALAEQRHHLDQLRGQLAVALASSERIAHELDRRIVRAPAAGVVAELAPLTAGVNVDANQSLGVIVGAGLRQPPS